MEIVADESEVHFDQFYAELTAMQSGTLEFTQVVVRSVNEVHCQGYALGTVVQKCHGVHASGEYYQSVFSGHFFMGLVYSCGDDTAAITAAIRDSARGRWRSSA